MSALCVWVRCVTFMRTQGKKGRQARHAQNTHTGRQAGSQAKRGSHTDQAGEMQGESPGEKACLVLSVWSCCRVY